MTAPTSDERREVAERVRKTRGIMAFVDALGIDVDSDWCWTDVSRRVADLIDLVGGYTTFALDEKSKDGEEVYPTLWWRCAMCGEETIMMYDEGKPVACPYCGAVANDDADQ
jgi:hypothetical protein